MKEKKEAAAEKEKEEEEKAYLVTASSSAGNPQHPPHHSSRQWPQESKIEKSALLFSLLSCSRVRVLKRPLFLMFLLLRAIVSQPKRPFHVSFLFLFFNFLLCNYALSPLVLLLKTTILLLFFLWYVYAYMYFFICIYIYIFHFSIMLSSK